MAKQPTEDEENLKRKARRRLVGAFALALAVIVILPMVLDNEPKPTGQDIDLRIPAPDKVGQFVPVVVPKMVAELPASSPVMVTPVPLNVAPVAPEPSVATTPVTAKPVEKDIQLKVAEPKVAQPKVDTKPTTKNDKQTTSAAAESFVAQVGAYNNAESAQKVLAELKGWSFKAYSEKFGDKIRVRVGPYPERKKVEKVKQLLEKHGLHPVVVSLP